MNAIIYALAAIGMAFLCVVVPVVLIAVIDLWTAKRD